MNLTTTSSTSETTLRDPATDGLRLPMAVDGLPGQLFSMRMANVKLRKKSRGLSGEASDALPGLVHLQIHNSTRSHGPNARAQRIVL